MRKVNILLLSMLTSFLFMYRAVVPLQNIDAFYKAYDKSGRQSYHLVNSEFPTTIKAPAGVFYVIRSFWISP